MERTITVRGTGTLRLKPDWTEITLRLKSLDRSYAKSAEKANAQLAALKGALAAAVFPEDSLRTVNFSVDAEREGKPDKDGHYRNVFKGYACIHELKLEFPFDIGRLSAAIAAVSGCTADPEMNVRFTVRDREKAVDELLSSAAANARQRAETLTKAAGVTLGALVGINYNVRTQDFDSPTGLLMAKHANAQGTVMDLAMSPEDIELSDSASFVWEIR